MPATDSINPRHLREKLAGWEGKRVVVGTHSYHYLCGTWTAIEGDHVVFQIGDHRPMSIRLAEIANVVEAPALQAEFFK
jgi:hypothetical protein